MKDGISASDKRAIINNLIRNEIIITFPRNDSIPDIMMDNIVSESMKVKDAICDESKLVFGGCIASEFSVDIVDSATRAFTAANLVGQWISVKIIQHFIGEEIIYPSEDLSPSDDIFPDKGLIKQHVFYIFSGYIDKASANKTNRNVRSIVAYDFMALLVSDKCDASNKLTSLWQAALTSTSSTAYPTVQNLLEYIFCENEILSNTVLKNSNISALPYIESEYLNEIRPLESGETDPSMEIKKFRTMNAAWLESNDMVTWGEILRDIGELFGLFGRVYPDEDIGAFRFLALGEGEETFSFYNTLSFDDEIFCEGYTGARVTVSSTSTTKTARNRTILSVEANEDEELRENLYDMTENILAWESDNAQIHRLESLFAGDTGSRYFNSCYTPVLATVDSRLWLEPGDKINIAQLNTDYDGNPLYDDDGNPVYDIVTSYVLSRVMSGVLALTDEIEAKGE